MKSNTNLLAIALGIFGLLLSSQIQGQTFSVLHDFSADWPYSTTNTDGTHPRDGLLSSGNTLYGLASDLCSFPGTIFKLNSDGSGFTTVHTLTEGACPNGVILSGNQFYGTFSDSPLTDYSTGMVYAVNTDGTGFRTLHRFFYNQGAHPNSLILLGNTLYGTTATGGTFYSGIVFAVDTNGMNFRTVYTFDGRNDGANPAGLVASGNTLYGTTSAGGTWSNGTVYAVNTDGTGFTNLHTFTATTPYNADGANPNARLLLSSYTLYGTTYYGGSSGVGTIFSINTNSTGFRTLHSFPPLNYDYRNSNTNSDGAYPISPLIISGRTLYGEGDIGGTLGSGTVFAMHTDGTGFSVLHRFLKTSSNMSTNIGGTSPLGGLVLLGNNLYGTAAGGGTAGNGTVFSVSIRPELTVAQSGANFILTWPTNFTGFTLQSTTNIASSAVWTTNLPSPVEINGLNTVTNPISGTQQFFRLSQ